MEDVFKEDFGDIKFSFVVEASPAVSDDLDVVGGDALVLDDGLDCEGRTKDSKLVVNFTFIVVV